jgi:hypothetical protein
MKVRQTSVKKLLMLVSKWIFLFDLFPTRLSTLVSTGYPIDVKLITINSKFSFSIITTNVFEVFQSWIELNYQIFCFDDLSAYQKGFLWEYILEIMGSITKKSWINHSITFVRLAAHSTPTRHRLDTPLLILTIHSKLNHFFLYII